MCAFEGLEKEKLMLAPVGFTHAGRAGEAAAGRARRFLALLLALAARSFWPAPFGRLRALPAPIVGSDDDVAIVRRGSCCSSSSCCIMDPAPAA